MHVSSERSAEIDWDPLWQMAGFLPKSTGDCFFWDGITFLLLTDIIEFEYFNSWSVVLLVRGQRDRSCTGSLKEFHPYGSQQRSRCRSKKYANLISCCPRRAFWARCSVFFSLVDFCWINDCSVQIIIVSSLLDLIISRNESYLICNCRLEIWLGIACKDRKTMRVILQLSKFYFYGIRLQLLNNRAGLVCYFSFSSELNRVYFELETLNSWLLTTLSQNSSFHFTDAV